jgi:hypothetical protein
MTLKIPLTLPRVTRIAVALTLAIVASLGVVQQAAAATYNPEIIISNDNMRNANAMSEKQIQALLETQTGPLKSLVTSDYAGVNRKASTIIWQACQAWNISPKVMLTMLQKEQSLLTRTTLKTNTLSRAIGAGCPNATTNRYPGFGRQMWNGARLLDSYGESSTVVPKYYPDIVRTDIYRKPNVTLHMKNIATYKLFCYNPSIGASAPYGDLSAQASSCTGNANFWLIYRRYFGSTFAYPRMMPIYRFRSYRTGTYLYTISVAERLKLRNATNKRNWAYEGAKFSMDTSVASALTTPVYRFKNKYTRKFSFVTSKATYDTRRTTSGRRTWEYQGIAFRVSRTKTTGAVTLYRFRNRKTGGYSLTASASTVNYYRTNANFRKKWAYAGIAYYLPRVPKT